MTDTEYKGGPRTPEGKLQSSLNAMKTGLRAKSPQALAELGKDLGIDYLDIIVDMDAHYRPKDHLENMLVKRIAKCVWRLALSDAMERRTLARRGVTEKPGLAYERILKYERLVDIHLHRAIETLKKKRDAENFANTTNEPQNHRF